MRVGYGLSDEVRIGRWENGGRESVEGERRIDGEGRDDGQIKEGKKKIRNKEEW